MRGDMPGPIEGRDLHTQQTSFLRGNMSHTRKKEPLFMGYIPPKAIITSIHALVPVAIANTKIKVGKTPDGQEFGELDVKAIGEKVLALANANMIAAEGEATPIYATFDSEPAAGDCVVVVQFVTNR